MLQVGHYVTGVIIQNRPDRDAYLVSLHEGGAPLGLLPKGLAFRAYHVSEGVGAAVAGMTLDTVRLTQHSIHYYKRIAELVFRPLILDDVVRVRNVATSPHAAFVKIAVETVGPGSIRGSVRGPIRMVHGLISQFARFTNRVVCVIPFSTDRAEFIRQALLPAPGSAISRCVLLRQARKAVVWVRPGHMGKVLGPGGMNVALAAKLTRYAIDVRETPQ